MIKVILMCVLISECFSQEKGCGDDYDRNVFAKFKERFARDYRSPMDEERHFQVFRKNLIVMRAHNAKFRQGNVTWEMGIGPYADITAESFMKRFEGYSDPYNTLGDFAIKKSCKSDSPNIYLKVDHTPYAGAVRDQKDCNAGWAFAAITTTETMLSKERGHVEVLSTQNIIDCAYGPQYGSAGCSGGNVLGALRYLQERGTTICEKYQYTASTGQCKAMNSNPYTINYIYQFGAPKLYEGLKYGPAATEFEVTPKLMHYMRGVFEDMECTGKANHAVTILGFDQDDKTGIHYYVLRNSWGRFWGENGNFKFKYFPKACSIGHNTYFVSVSNAEPGCCS